MDQAPVPLTVRVNRAECHAALASKLAMIALALVVGLVILRVLIMAPALAQGETTVLKAPIQVVDDKGRPFLMIHYRNGEGRIELYNRRGWVAAGMAAGDIHGKVFGSRGTTKVELGE